MLERARASTAWSRGVTALQESQDVPAATEWFERAVQLDPTMADAWLGLHAVGVRTGEALTAMVEHAAGFGAERRRFHTTLSSRFWLGHYVTYRLESLEELWWAVAADALAREDYDAVEAALAATPSGSPVTSFLRGRAAVRRRSEGGSHREDAVLHLRPVTTCSDAYLQVEARLLTAVVLREMGVRAPALEHLRWLLGQRVIEECHPEARFHLGLMARTDGHHAAARRLLEEAYAAAPQLEGLREALGAYQAGPGVDDRAAPRPPGRTSTGPSPRPAPAAVEEDAEPATTPRPQDPDPQRESVEDVLADLDAQIGQEALKHQVRMLLAHSKAQLARREVGLREARMTEHLVFTGPPGTGKTTIARVVGRLYKALDILEHGEVVEVDRSDLVGQYHGHSVANTTAVIDKALGGVLFVDEAYSLQTAGFTDGDPFGTEVINTLLKRMEDDRDRLVVIVAGYPEPMQEFLDANPGLRSRFTTTIDFEPYSVEQLVEIAHVMAAAAGDRLDAGATDRLRELLLALRSSGAMDDPSFGNARYVRTLLEKADRARNHRLFASGGDTRPGREDLTTLTRADVDAASG